MSPHEFATLMLIRHAPEEIDLNRHELDILLERQLVALETRAEGARLPSLTMAGHSLLEALGRAGSVCVLHDDMSFDTH